MNHSSILHMSVTQKSKLAYHHQGFDKVMQLSNIISIHCWFVLSEISQMALATCSLLPHRRSHMWCDLRKKRHMLHRVKLKKLSRQINSIILMFFFIFDSLWISVSFDTSITGGPSKKFWRENSSNFHMIPKTQILYFALCDGFSQITFHIEKTSPS